MKNLYILLLCLLSLMSVQTHANTKRIISGHQIEMIQNTYRLIHKIELNDEHTVVYGNVYHYPNYWCKMSSQIILQGESGKKYKLIRLEGMELDKEVYMPDSGTMPFVIYFEPLDDNELKLEMIDEGKEKDEQLICRINLLDTTSKSPIQCLIKGEVFDRPYSNRLKIVKNMGDFRIEGEYIPILGGKFEYLLNVDYEEAYTIAFVDEINSSSYIPVVFFTTNGTVDMKLYPQDRSMENTIEGGVLNEISTGLTQQKINQYKDEWELLNSEWDELYEKDEVNSPEAKEIYDKLSENNESIVDSLYRELDRLRKTNDIYAPQAKILKEKGDEISKKQNIWELQYFKEHVSVVGFYMLIRNLMHISYNPLGAEPYIELYNQVYKNKYAGHPYVEKIEAMILALTSIQKGGKYIDFTAPDFEGNLVTLSAFISGKVALIDLWASWCGPCRRASTSMIPIYDEFKDRGFTVLAVARERKLSDGLHAYQKDGYPWTCLIDLNDKNGIWEKYGIGNSGGATFLVDKEGTILAIQPTAHEVRQILNDLLK